MIRECNLCGSKEIEPLHRFIPGRRIQDPKRDYSPTSPDFGVFYDLARCARCKVIFSLAHDEDIQAGYGASSDELYLSQSEERSIAYRKLLSEVRQFVPGSPKARLLDIGCSYGIFLGLARESGFEVCGIEASKDASRYCRESLNLDVSCADMHNADLGNDAFDVITALEVIEHSADPKKFIIRISKLLRPGGILYLVTPDTSSLSGRFLGPRWWSFRRMHRYYFSKDSLSAFLRNNGFTVLAAKPYKKTFRIGYIVRQLCHWGAGRFFGRILSGLVRGAGIQDRLLTLSFGDLALVARRI